MQTITDTYQLKYQLIYWEGEDSYQVNIYQYRTDTRIVNLFCVLLIGIIAHLQAGQRLPVTYYFIFVYHVDLI